MSWRDSSNSPCNSLKLQRSVTTLRGNSTLPAPMKATLTIRPILHECAIRTNNVHKTCTFLRVIAAIGLGAYDAAPSTLDGIHRGLRRTGVGDQHVHFVHRA